MKFVGLIVFFICWMTFASLNLVNPIFIPDPISVFKKLGDLLITKFFFTDFFATTYRFVIGLIISIIVGIPLGLFLGYYKSIYSTLELLFDFFRSIPATALFPLSILLFGIGNGAKIALVSFSSTLILLLNTYYGVINASKVRFDVLKIYNQNNLSIFKNLLIYEALPNIFTGIRVTASLALILVIVTEMFIGTQSGLGKRLIDAQTTYRIEELYALIIFIGFFGYFVNQFVIFIEKKNIKWK